MSQPFDASRSLTSLEQDSTIIAVIEMSQAKWLVAAVVPGVERQPLKRLDADEAALLKLLHRWRNEAGQAGRQVKRIVVAYEAGRDGFWLARWLRVRGIEAYIIHPASIAVSREHRRAKTDRLDTELLMRAFLGWLRNPHGFSKLILRIRSRHEVAMFARLLLRRLHRGDHTGAWVHDRFPG
jgi:transposase